MSFTETFIDNSVEILKSLDVSAIDAVAAVMAETKRAGGRLFFCGSGGGAGHASHAAADFRKLGGFEAYCVTDNVSELTARINDEGWDGAYAAWLGASRMTERDCLFVFSVGGGSVEPPVSVNLVQAVDYAVRCGAKVVGVVGRDGGHVKATADACIVVPTVEATQVTPQVEGFQAVMWHLLVSHPDICAATAKWEGLSEEHAT